MKNKHDIKRQIPALAVVLFVFLVFISLASIQGCKKESNTSAIITVVDAVFKQPVRGATVRLQMDTLTNPAGTNAVPPNPDRLTTDTRGQVVFTIKNVATYFAEVTKPPSPDTATKLVRFIKHRTVEVTIEF